MSRGQHHDRHGRHGCGGSGAIHRVLNGLSSACGVRRDVVIAGFVIGLFFVPMLTVLIFGVAWYWVTYPARARRHVEWLSERARRMVARLGEATFGRDPHRPATAPGFDPSDGDEAPASKRESEPRRPSTVSDLSERFEELERRAKSIEAYVASEEYRLEREFRKMDDSEN